MVDNLKLTLSARPQYTSFTPKQIDERLRVLEGEDYLREKRSLLEFNKLCIVFQGIKEESEYYKDWITYLNARDNDLHAEDLDGLVDLDELERSQIAYENLMGEGGNTEEKGDLNFQKIIKEVDAILAREGTDPAITEIKKGEGGKIGKLLFFPLFGGKK